jgi:Uma2 family endonuclease
VSSILETHQAIADVAVPPLPSDILGRLSLEQFHRMVRQGILTENSPVELWEGVLVQKMPKSRAHCLATELVFRALASRAPGGWHVEGQESVTLLGSETEPDAMFVRGTERDYVDRHPGAGDLGLVVEVSDSTLAYDRGFKKDLYATARVPAYWIVNLADHRVEAFSDAGATPAAPGYGRPDTFHESEEIPLILAGSKVGLVPVRELPP